VPALVVLVSGARFWHGRSSSPLVLLVTLVLLGGIGHNVVGSSCWHWS